MRHTAICTHCGIRFERINDAWTPINWPHLHGPPELCHPYLMDETAEQQRINDIVAGHELSR